MRRYVFAGGDFSGRGCGSPRRQWLANGFKNSEEANPDISDVVDKDYYRDVAQTSRYIKDHWSQYLDVIEIIPGGFGHFHEAVICRAKTA